MADAVEPAALNSAAYTVNCSDTRYHVVRTAAASRGWAIEDERRAEAVPSAFHGVAIADRTLHTDPTTDGLTTARATAYDPRRCPQVLWVDRSVVPSRVAGLRWHQRLNHFAGMNAIARKALLFKRLMRIRKACGGDANSCNDSDSADTGEGLAAAADLHRVMDVMYPRSFSSLSDGAALGRYADEAAGAQFFIMKPNKGCQGRGIRVTRDPLECLTVEECRSKDAECLVQVYVDRPLLIDGKKFDLRLYVLLTSVVPPRAPGTPTAAVPAGPLDGIHLYVHEEGLVRLCAASYERPTDANCSQGSAHLTNYALNKREAGFSVADPHGTAMVVDEGNKRDLAFMRSFVDGLGHGGGWAAVRRRINECIVLTVLSGVGPLRRELAGARACRGERGDGRNCFELLGFDVMLSADGAAPVLMEVNHSPSLFCETAFDFTVKQRVLRDCLALVEAYTPTARQRAATKRQALPWTWPAGAEERLVTSGAVGFSQLLPRYALAGCEAGKSPAVEDWSEVERARQVQMTQLGTAAL